MTTGCIGRHLVPQLTPIIIASATIRVANNILVESGLSFLGLGVAPPTPTWGNMVADGADAMRQAWWLVAIPGVTIFVVVLAFNLMGEGICAICSIPAGSDGERCATGLTGW